MLRLSLAMKRLTASAVLSLVSMIVSLSPLPAAGTATPPRTFSELPAEIRRHILLGTPRRSADIAESPFGTHTTIMQEGGNADYIRKAPGLLADAGYKWVVEYLTIGAAESLPVEQVDARFATLPARCFTYAEALRRADIGLIMRIDPIRWTPWNGPSKVSLDENSDDMRRAQVFTRHVVRQLKPYARHWQIWNEPNIGNAQPILQPEDYVKLVAFIARIIREEQPDALILAPGTAMLQCLAPHPLPWLPRALDAGLLDHIDIFTFHPYRQPATRDNIPEHASEFHPWQTWGTYEKQIADLRGRLARRSGGKTIPLAATEDGMPTLINGRGEQEITWVIGAKYELRRALLDFRLGVHPRTQFAFYRPIGENYYDIQGSYNLLTNDLQPKPAWYASQNLHAVLDHSYQPDDTVRLTLTPDTAAKPKGELVAHCYRKQHAGFDELLVFFWSAEVSDDLHARYPATLRLQESGWEAPLLIDLMAMPAKRPKNEIVELIDSQFVNRRDPEQLRPARTATGVEVRGLEIRDYPQLIKLVRPR